MPEFFQMENKHLWTNHSTIRHYIPSSITFLIIWLLQGQETMVQKQNKWIQNRSLRSPLPCALASTLRSLVCWALWAGPAAIVRFSGAPQPGWVHLSHLLHPSHATESCFKNSILIDASPSRLLACSASHKHLPPMHLYNAWASLEPLAFPKALLAALRYIMRMNNWKYTLFCHDYDSVLSSISKPLPMCYFRHSYWEDAKCAPHCTKRLY